jgi:hypothetical protein
VHHICDVLWDYASLEAGRRREAELEVARSGWTDGSGSSSSAG